MHRLENNIAATVVLLVATCGSLGAQSIITTYAGTDWIFNGDGKPALSVRFKNPVAITVDPNGNPVVADGAFGIVARRMKWQSGVAPCTGAR